MLTEALEPSPIIAILRGIRPDETQDIGMGLYEVGLRCIEVPLNSPDPLKSIEILAKTLPEDCIVGAGTVTRQREVLEVVGAGGRIIVTPNVSPAVIETALSAKIDIVPGFATATDAFSAIHAGAQSLKLFPAGSYGLGHLKALKAVLPENVNVLAVGGINASNMSEWQQAGACGFGIGSDIYRPGDTAEEVRKKATELVQRASQSAGWGG